MVRASVSAAASISKRVNSPSRATATTVRHGTGAGDGGAERDALGLIGTGDADAPEIAAGLHGADLPDVGDDAGEHRRPLRSGPSGRPPASRYSTDGIARGRLEAARPATGVSAGRPSPPQRLHAGVKDDLVGEAGREQAFRHARPALAENARDPAIGKKMQHRLEIEPPVSLVTRDNLDAVASSKARRRFVGTHHRRRSRAAASRARSQRDASAATATAARSRTMRSGLRLRKPGRRTVISGSSSRAVPAPTMMASCSERCTWVKASAIGPVMCRRGSWAGAGGVTVRSSREFQRDHRPTAA